MEAEVYSDDLTNINITISIGLAQYDSKIDKSSVDLIKRSDSALYTAKRHGRNRTVKFED
jgi:diguanylate cyclase (GGDEF)-like protein